MSQASLPLISFFGSHARVDMAPSSSLRPNTASTTSGTIRRIKVLIPTGEFEDRSIPVMAGLVPAISGQFPAKPYESTNPPVGISCITVPSLPSIAKSAKNLAFSASDIGMRAAMTMHSAIERPSCGGGGWLCAPHTGRRCRYRAGAVVCIARLPRLGMSLSLERSPR
jgi:hypothetical protein